MSDTYCPLPWIGMNVLPDGITPCCQWTGKGQLVETDSIDSTIIEPFFEKIRQEMLQGNTVKGCEQCYSAERVGAKSRRQDAIEMYGRPTEVKLQLLDINFDNVCNLKCRGCATTSSHLWYNDELEIYGKTFADKKYIEHNFDIDLDGLTYVNISGGEPFLSKKFEQFAKKILDRNLYENLHIVISTNGTVLPSETIYSLLQKANKLSLSISIDGIGDLNRYFRHGAEFNDCLKTIEYLKNLKELRKEKYTYLQVHTTVSIYNVNLLKDIEDYFAERYPEYETNHRLLYWPAQLCIRNMPEDLKSIIKPFVESLGEKYIDVINELNTPGPDLFNHFLNFHNTLDSLRHESLEHINPMLYEYIKKYSKLLINSRTFFLEQMEVIK